MRLWLKTKSLFKPKRDLSQQNIFINKFINKIFNFTHGKYLKNS